jgi:hypothetical protein
VLYLLAGSTKAKNKNDVINVNVGLGLVLQMEKRLFGNQAIKPTFPKMGCNTI